MTERATYIPPDPRAPASGKEDPKRERPRWPEHRVIRFEKGRPVEIIDLDDHHMQFWEIFRGAVGVSQTIKRAAQWGSKSRKRKTISPRR